MANKRIVEYLMEGINRGHNMGSLKQQLLKSGFQEKLVNEAILEIKGIAPPKTLTINQSLQTSTALKETTPARLSSPINEEQLIEEVPGLDSHSEKNPFDYSRKAVTKKQGVFWKMGKSIVSPGELFTSVKGEEVWSTLKYYLVLLLIPFIISTVGTLFFLDTISDALRLINIDFPPTGITLTAVYISIFAFMIFIMIPVISFIIAGIFHLSIKIYGGKGTFKDTFAVTVYSSTPSFLFPFILISPLWSVILDISGISKNHSISKIRAILAILTPEILIGIAISLIYFLIPEATTVGPAV